MKNIYLSDIALVTESCVTWTQNYIAQGRKYVLVVLVKIINIFHKYLSRIWRFICSVWVVIIIYNLIQQY